MNLTATVIFLALFIVITVLGFIAAYWRQGNLAHLHEWGLGGRRFGTWMTWFLLGGDLYTAYTFIAVPAFVFGVGAMGFFIVPGVIILYPLIFLIFPKFWQLAKERGYITAADFIHDRYNSRLLALVVALTGIVATMPYIALQLVGIEVVIGGLGIDTAGWLGELPLMIAFAILATYTYKSGLRAPAMIAIVKDFLIYMTLIAAMLIIPAQLGGFHDIFKAVDAEKLLLKAPDSSSLHGYSAYATLAIGSVMAFVLYPHCVTAFLSAQSGNTIRRNAVLLPAYSVVLALLALLGFMALAAGVKDMPEFAPYFEKYGLNFAVPALFMHFFPSWLVGVAFATIAISALVPAAIMSIAAANLYTRNIHRVFIQPTITSSQETQVAKWASLVVKVGALAFIMFFPTTYAVQWQLLGGIWMIQTFPSLIFGLYTRVLDARALVCGWGVGIVCATWMVVSLELKSSLFVLPVFNVSIPGYAAVWSVLLNMTVALIGTMAIWLLSNSQVYSKA